MRNLLLLISCALTTFALNAHDLMNKKRITVKKCFVLLLLILSSNILVAQDCFDSESYYQYIKNNGQPHLEYVLDKIRSHSVVAIGEDHWIDAHPQFLCKLITASAKDSTANIDAVAVEF